MAKLISAWIVTAALLLCAAPVSASGATNSTSSPTPTAAPTHSASPPAAPGASTDPLVQQLQKQLADQAALEATKLALAASVVAAQGQQSALASVITANQTAIKDTLTKLAVAEQQFHDAAAKQAADHAAAQLARQHEIDDRAELAGYMRERYISQDNLASYVLASNSISEMFGRAADVSHLVDRGQELVLKLQQDVIDADTAETAARLDSEAAQRAARVLSDQELQLQAQTDQAKQLMSKLGVQEQAAAREIALANQQSLAVAESIAALRISELDATIAAAMQADWQAASYWIQQHLGILPKGFKDPGPTPPGGTHFVWPAPGTQLVQLFGPSPYAFEPPYGGYPHFHTGIDLTRAAGSPILAAADGVVVVAGTSNVGYGNYIILAHAGGFLTLYAHLEAMLINPGDTVHQGQLIGLMGSTGNSTGPHLHFEVRYNANPVDPVLFLPPLPPGATGPPAIPGQ